MLAVLATRMRCSQCGKKVAEVVAVEAARARAVAAQLSHARRSRPIGKRSQMARRRVSSACQPPHRRADDEVRGG
jgi:hypothetical protein